MINDDKLSIALKIGDIYIYNINTFLILEIKIIMKDNSILIYYFYDMIIIEID